LKKLHRSDFFSWSVFNEERNIDFNGTLWVSPLGNVLIDPLPLIEHDKKHLENLGGAAHLIITNSDHVRDTAKILSFTGAKCWGPSAEKEHFPFACDGWLGEEEQPIKGIEVFSLNGSKTTGELALLIDEKTLVTGDLIRAHEGGRLFESIKRMASKKGIQAVIPGDGWPVFQNGHEVLLALSEEL